MKNPGGLFDNDKPTVTDQFIEDCLLGTETGPGKILLLVSVRDDDGCSFSIRLQGGDE